jgi:hypothetical protein
MGNPTTKKLEKKFERYCDRCLWLAVNEYLKRADSKQLEELKAIVEATLVVLKNNYFEDDLLSVLEESAAEREAER